MEFEEVYIFQEPSLCVCCGQPVPEGRQICWCCEQILYKDVREAS